QDPVRLAFGLGLGNASNSNLGDSFTGRYYELFQAFVLTSFSVFLLELGVLGVTVAFVLYWFVFADSLAVARADSGLMGAVAVAWVGVVIVMTAATFYTKTHTFASVSYLYWYFSGMVAARRTQLAFAEQRARLPARLRGLAT